MKLKGNMVIEMIDDATGEVVERAQEENMVTNAVNHILGLNPMGIFYSVAGEYDTHLLWNDNLLPICPNMIGGILLYSEALTEDADNIYPSTAKLPVAYASNDVNATADVARGSMNLTESKPLDNGYRFVWEFTPSQGNGTIAAVALTSKQGGVAAYGSMENSKAAFYQIMETRLETQTVEELAELFSAMEWAINDENVTNIALDIVLVGIPAKGPNGLEAGPLSDFIRKKFDEVFSPEEMEKLANSKKSKVPFDAQDNRNTTEYVEGMSAYYHRLLSLGHDPLLGFVFGVYDIMHGTMTTIDKSGKIVCQVMENYADRKESDIVSAIAKQIIHFKPHRKAGDPLYNDDCLYTPGVIVFKSDISFPERMGEKDWYQVDVITCAAPNLRDMPSNLMNPFAGNAPADIEDDGLYG